MEELDSHLGKNGNLLEWAGPRLMTINGDEGEPGTFKDKLYLETNMHKFFEGMLIAAWAVEAKIYIYMRDEYPGIIKKMRKELNKLQKSDVLDHKTKIYIRRGAGAYAVRNPL